MKKHHYCLCRIENHHGWQLALEKSVGYTEIAVQPEGLVDGRTGNKPVITFLRGDSDCVQLNVSDRAKALVRARAYLEQRYQKDGIDIGSVMSIPDEIRHAH